MTSIAIVVVAFGFFLGDASFGIGGSGAFAEADAGVVARFELHQIGVDGGLVLARLDVLRKEVVDGSLVERRHRLLTLDWRPADGLLRVDLLDPAAHLIEFAAAAVVQGRERGHLVGAALGGLFFLAGWSPASSEAAISCRAEGEDRNAFCFVKLLPTAAAGDGAAERSFAKLGDGW